MSDQSLYVLPLYEATGFSSLKYWIFISIEVRDYREDLISIYLQYKKLGYPYLKYDSSWITPNNIR